MVRAGHPDFLDLPWSEPLEEWRSDRIVRMARGVVPARRPLRRLRRPRLRPQGDRRRVRASASTACCSALREENLPRVEPVGVARWRGGGRRRDGRARDAHHPLPRLLAALPLPARPARPPRACSTACSTAAPCSWPACTWRASTGATSRSRTPSSAATPAPSSSTWWTPRPPSSAPPLSDGMRANDVEVAVENIAGGLRRPPGGRPDRGGPRPVRAAPRASATATAPSGTS